MRTLKSIVVLALAAGLAVGGADVAKADPSDDPVDQALQAIEAVSPELLDDAINLTPEEGGDAAIEADIEDVQITVPTDPSDPLTFESDDGDIAIVLPASAEASDAVAARDGVVVFDNNDGSTTTPIVREDATLQINTVIQSPEAPVAYSYQIDLPVGTTIERDGESLYFLNGDTLVGGLAPAWAQDADGQTVTTRYEVDGSTVTQIVEHDATFTYPVVADWQEPVRLRTQQRPGPIQQEAGLHDGALGVGTADLSRKCSPWPRRTARDWPPGDCSRL